MNSIELIGVSKDFGNVKALQDINLTFEEGKIYGLLGRNGAGKTTAFNCVTGVYAPTNGQVLFGGKVIVSNHPSGKMAKMYLGADKDKFHQVAAPSPDKITRMGIARTFQNIRLFKTQTVFDNVLIATHLHRTSNLFSASLHLNFKEEKRLRALALEMLEVVGLQDLRDELAVSLPYGKQRRLEIARALATRPRLLLLDEPAAGMNPQESDDLARFIQGIKKQFDLSVFLIEHHMDLVMDISDRVYVIDFGRMIASGTPAEVQDNPDVITAYLGVDEE